MEERGLELFFEWVSVVGGYCFHGDVFGFRKDLGILLRVKRVEKK